MFQLVSENGWMPSNPLRVHLIDDSNPIISGNVSHRLRNMPVAFLVGILFGLDMLNTVV